VRPRYRRHTRHERTGAVALSPGMG
jgi:hypothetical protein